MRRTMCKCVCASEKGRKTVMGVRGGFDSAGYPDPLHPLPLCSGFDKWSQSLWGLRIPVWNEYAHAHRNTRTGIRPLLHSCVRLGSSPVVLPSTPKLSPSSKVTACLSYASLPLFSSDSHKPLSAVFLSSQQATLIIMQS